MRGSNNLVPPSTRRYLSLAEAYYHLGPHRGVHQFPGGHDNVPPHFQEPTYPVEPSFMGIIPLFKWIFKSAFTFLAFFSSSIVLYGLVYLVVMPSHHASERLFFDYSGLAKHPAPVLMESSSSFPSTNVVKRGSNQKNRPPSSSPSRGTGSTIEEQSTIPFTAPWAAADLFSKHSQWEAFHQDVIPSLKSNERILIAGQPYFLELALELPESDINQRAGVFGVQMELQASNGTKLASSIRTARLPHESSWVSVVRKSVWLVPLLLGAVHESRVVVIPSFGHFVESDDLPLRYVTVNILMQDAAIMKPLEIISAEVHIGEELSPFQLILKEWFFTSYMMGSSIFFLIQLLLYLLVQSRRSKTTQEFFQFVEEPFCDLDLDSSIPMEGDGDGNSHANGSANPSQEDEDENSSQWESLHSHASNPPTIITEQNDGTSSTNDAGVDEHRAQSSPQAVENAEVQENTSSGNQGSEASAERRQDDDNNHQI